jgi:hypothetical protein
LHKCNEVLKKKFTITFRVHVLHQEYLVSSTVWYAFSAENTLNCTILCVKYIISVKGWIWCPTPATAVFVNYPVQTKMTLSLSHMFIISWVQHRNVWRHSDVCVMTTSCLTSLDLQILSQSSLCCLRTGVKLLQETRNWLRWTISTRSSSCYLVLSVLPVRLRPATFGIAYHRRRFLQIFTQDS